MDSTIQLVSCKNCNTQKTASDFYVATGRKKPIQPCIECHKGRYRDRHPIEKPEDLHGEEWRVLADHPNYAISNKGRIKRVTSGYATHDCRIRKPHSHGRRGDYRRVSLNGAFFYVHRLVAIAFIPTDSFRLFVNHKDGNPSNNTAENLEWCTQQENATHAASELLAYSKKLDPDKIRLIRKLRDQGFNNNEIAAKCGINQSTVSRILTGKIWNHVE